MREFIELALQITKHDMQVWEAASSNAVTSSELKAPPAAATMGSTRTSGLTEPACAVTFPASVGPPVTKIASMFSRLAANEMSIVLLQDWKCSPSRRRIVRSPYTTRNPRPVHSTASNTAPLHGPWRCIHQRRWCSTLSGCQQIFRSRTPQDVQDLSAAPEPAQTT